MMRISWGVVLSLLVGSAAVLAQPDAGAKASASQERVKVRIGVYDSRAIAVAYAPSRFNPVREKMAEHQAAKTAGDQQKVKELEAWGEEHQQMLHFQGFCRVPVSDLLQPVKARLDQIAADEHLAAIVMSFDVTSVDVEIVDVTDRIVELYEPNERTREMILKVRKSEPIPLTSIGKHGSRE
jgi:hypothetical protein